MELDRKAELEIEQDILYSVIEDDINKKAKAISKKKKKKFRFKEIKIKTLLLLIITLIMNTYAWFVYISTVSVGLNMHIKSWNFEIRNDDSETQNFEFFVENIYPGVPTETTIQTINAANNGELDALLTCEVQYIRILDEEFAVAQKYTETPLTEFYSNQELLEKLYKDYPFKVKIYFITNEDGLKNEILYEGDEKLIPIGTDIEVKLQVEWPYELNTEITNTTNLEEADQKDTYWGEEAHKFHEANPDKYSIVVKLDVKAKQKIDEEDIAP